MQTRSMTRITTTNTNTHIIKNYLYEYEVNINFEEASSCWKANKQYLGNGQYKYICNQNTKSGNQCKRESLSGCNYCKMHNKYK